MMADEAIVDPRATVEVVSLASGALSRMRDLFYIFNAPAHLRASDYNAAAEPPLPSLTYARVLPMRNLAISVVLAALLLSTSIVWHAHALRYEVAQITDGMVVRLDRETGETVACLAHRGSDGVPVVAACTGLRE